jgi:hypothetical protein
VRTARQSIYRVENIVSAVRNAIRDILEIANKGVELDAVAKMAPARQATAVAMVTVGIAANIRAAPGYKLPLMRRRWLYRKRRSPIHRRHSHDCDLALRGKNAGRGISILRVLLRHRSRTHRAIHRYGRLSHCTPSEPGVLRTIQERFARRCFPECRSAFLAEASSAMRRPLGESR